MKKKLTLFDYVNSFILLFVTAICIYPFVNMIAVSLSNGYYVQAGKVFLYPRGINIETFKYIFTSELPIMRALLNSVLYTSLGTIVAVLTTFITAYCLSRKRFIGRNVIMFLILITMIVDAGLIPHYLQIKNLHLLGTIWSMVLPGAVNVVFLIITKAFLESQPVDLEESAFMDGANDFQVMTRIFMPLSTPVLATITIFYSVSIWNAYLAPVLYLQKTELYPIQVILYQLVIQPASSLQTLPTEVTSEYLMYPGNLKAAITFLGVFPIMLIYPFAQRYFTKGLMLGALKG